MFKKNKKTKMQLFQTTRKHLAALGFIPKHSCHRHHHFNKQHFRNILIAILTIASEYVYIFREAGSIDRYMHSCFMATVIIAINISYVTLIFKTTEIYDFIGNFEKLTNQSE